MQQLVVAVSGTLIQLMTASTPSVLTPDNPIMPSCTYVRSRRCTHAGRCKYTEVMGVVVLCF